MAALALVQPLHGFTFALLHLATMRVIGDTVPRPLAATAQTVYGVVGVQRTYDASIKCMLDIERIDHISDEFAGRGRKRVGPEHYAGPLLASQDFKSQKI
jgi:hypothetical protein